MEKKNREQRRRDKFGHAGGATKDPWPQSEVNPVFGHGGPADDPGQAEADPPVRTGDTDQAPQKTSAAAGAPKKARAPKKALAKSSIAKASTRATAPKADKP